MFDLWADQWRRRNARGDMILTRFADDYVVGFEHRDDAERFLADLRDRSRIGLGLHLGEGVEPGRGAGVAAGPFPRPARRTGRAHS